MNRLKELRKRKGISQLELGDATGLSDKAISFYENEKRKPKIESWQKLADYFNVTVRYIQGYSPYRISVNINPVTNIKNYAVVFDDVTYSPFGTLEEASEFIKEKQIGVKTND